MKITINVLLIPVAIAILLTGQFEMYVIAYFFAFLHEIAHVVIAKRFNLEVNEIEFLPIGFNARILGTWKLSVERELVLFLCGPAINLFFSVFFLLVSSIVSTTNTKILIELITVNLFLACFNMIPMVPLDGGRILMIILSREIGIIKCAYFCIYISKLINVILLVLGIMLFLVSGNYIVIIIICYVLGFVLNEGTHIISDTFLYILNKKNLINKNRIARIKPLVACETTCLIRLLREIDRNRIITALIFSRDNKVMGTVDEFEVLEYVLMQGPNAVVGDLLKTKKPLS